MKTQTRRIFQAIFWIFLYLLLTAAPLLVLLVNDRPAGREFWKEFSVALGFCGLAMVSLQFVLTARFKTVKAPYGSDIVYFFHRQVSIVTFFLILAHPLLLFIGSPGDYLPLLNVFSVATPWAARLGVAAVLCLGGLVGLSIYRKRLRFEYTAWRIAHGLLAILAVGLATGHIILRAYYLNTPAKQALWTVYGLFWIGLLVWVRLVKPFLLLRKPWRVAEVRSEPGNSWTLVLQPKNHDGMTFHPGQFAWITAFSSPFADTEHPFSLSSSAARADKISFTIKELGDFTRSIKSLKPGDRVYVDGPFGSFGIDSHPHAQQFAFIAGGIGITPMISMLRTMHDRGDRRPVLLIYANRDLESAPFVDEINSLTGELNLKVQYVLEKPPAGWQGGTGFINQDLLKKHLPDGLAPNTMEIFICGPKPMMDAVEKALVQLGTPLGDFHSERFDLV